MFRLMQYSKSLFSYAIGKYIWHYGGIRGGTSVIPPFPHPSTLRPGETPGSEIGVMDEGQRVVLVREEPYALLYIILQNWNRELFVALLSWCPYQLASPRFSIHGKLDFIAVTSFLTIYNMHMHVGWWVSNWYSDLKYRIMSWKSIPYFILVSQDLLKSSHYKLLKVKCAET